MMDILLTFTLPEILENTCKIISTVSLPRNISVNSSATTGDIYI